MEGAEYLERHQVGVGDSRSCANNEGGGRGLLKKKQGATGITTVAPYIAGQWGRGE